MHIILPLLTFMFFIMKVAGVVTWSWWVVFSPMLFGLVVFLLMTVVLIFIFRKIKKDTNYSWSEVVQYWINYKGNK